MKAPLDVVNLYIALVQEFNTDTAAYAELLHPEIEQTEYPNLVYKTIQRRSFDEIIDNIRIGRELLHSQSFDVQHTHTGPDGCVLVEGTWQAVAVNDMASMTRGQQIKAHLCLVFEFKDGKIYRQRRYSGYEQA
ncbi:nuclear transport factor 2 family protein [Hymenobacter sp. BT186]|uniref:Nuclear transport factor 2 family protein n=1 Tax=Hymenobacter telluris TaxID=2816474 RepID=A0A939F2Q3_9BACT|nr:nuclear transport factor 2 family protein [Hymenobacter telluris]MBO0360293.1 nuclear transport factor 2 family protein [Hymenobacter telluris]MBW3376320.1 nuclear transport factor 2 family protein [Hymenobacter norwichensis]